MTDRERETMERAYIEMLRFWLDFYQAFFLGLIPEFE